MGALNVEFSDADLEDLREVARSRGMTLKAFVRESTRDAIAHQRALKAAADEFQRVFTDPALTDAIAAAGIDDGPASGAMGRAA
ncbi:hypothetical protein [Streptomyces sp. NPDC001508]|uniref:hypothetical protein n=1 Tax=Streptomyces sp. NPDC001508 TaxID=3154656 RepID=UPI00331F2C8C